ncbi:hypothetical protein C8R45DRAFT_307587 [Mycena sanguinolenta]|nr:hypothetical protein C8R45DRAFT_307587 [Mycena sanguinolenta]
MASVDTVSPLLPPELEQTIFEVIALSWPRSIPRLMLVAWRVKSWVEPLLYRTIIVGSPAAFFRDSVRVCSGVEDLRASQTSLVVSEIQFDRPLKRLHGGLGCIFGSSRSARIDFTRPIFACLTHLEIFGLPEDEIDLQVWTASTRLPHLTHLAFDDDGYLPMCGALLPGWERLWVLVILFTRRRGDLNAELFADYDVPELAEDPRVVLMICPEYIEDWIKGAHTGCDDYWSRAEDHIAKRRSRRVDLRDCYVPGTDDM